MKIAFVTSNWYLDTAVPLINSLLPYIDITMIINCLHTHKANIFLSNDFISQKAAMVELTADQMESLTGYMSLLRKKEGNLRVIFFFHKNFTTLSLNNLLNIHGVTRCLKSADIIHTQTMSSQYFFAMCALYRKNLVVDIHDFIQHSGSQLSPWSKMVIRQWLLRSKTIITHNHLDFNRIKEIPVLASKKIYLVPLGPICLTKEHHEINYFQKEPTIIFFGRIESYKGIEYLVDAVPMIKKEIPKLKVIIAGPGNYYLKIGSLKNDDTYEIINHYIPNERLANLISKSAIVVCPYTDATQSGVIMTAYAYGKPVVATDVGGIPEVVEDGITGYLVPPRNSARLAQAIISLLKDETLRKTISINIYNKFGEKNNAWNAIAKTTLEIYKREINKT